MKLGDQVMRTGSSDFLSLGRRGRTGQLAQPKRHRKSRDYRIDLEGLESRTLLATTPAVTATGDPVALSPFGSQVPFAGQQFNLPLQSVTTSGNANSPAVAIDPYDSSKLFAVWGVDLSTLTPPLPITTAIVEGAYSNDGGTTWTGLGEIVLPLTDAATVTATPPTPYTQVTDPTIGFDAQGNVYVLTLQTTGPADGALVSSKWSFPEIHQHMLTTPTMTRGFLTTVTKLFTVGCRLPTRQTLPHSRSTLDYLIPPPDCRQTPTQTMFTLPGPAPTSIQQTPTPRYSSILIAPSWSSLPMAVTPLAVRRFSVQVAISAAPPTACKTFHTRARDQPE